MKSVLTRTFDLQVIIVLYLLVPFYDQIYDWGMTITAKKALNGAAHFISAGRIEACLLEKVLGKLFLSVLFQSLSLTMARYLKYGMSLFEHLGNMWPLFFSYITQIVARILVLVVLFVTAEDILQIHDKGLAITLFFVLHFFLIFCIKISFEVHSKDYRSNDLKRVAIGIMKFLINLISSSMVYIWAPINNYANNPRNNVHEHNTFLPQLLFQVTMLT